MKCTKLCRQPPSTTKIDATFVHLCSLLEICNCIIFNTELKKSSLLMADLKGGTRPPWVGLGASVWIQIASANSYTFPLYSHSLKSVLGFNQRQITLLGVAIDVGENVGLLPGVASNKFPPWVILCVGALACFIGYGVLWLAVTKTITSLPYWLVSSSSTLFFLQFCLLCFVFSSL